MAAGTTGGEGVSLARAPLPPLRVNHSLCAAKSHAAVGLEGGRSCEDKDAVLLSQVHMG